MTEGELIKISIEEFLRVQRYLLLTEKSTEVYKEIHNRYLALKAILSALGVNLTELDEIKA